MSSTNKGHSYTFQDWLDNALIEESYVSSDHETVLTANGIPLHRLLSSRRDQERLISNNLISEKSITEIRDKQKTAYNHLFDNLWTNKQAKLEEIQLSGDYESYSQIRGNHLKRLIQNMESNYASIAERYYSGKPPAYLIDPTLYRLILNNLDDLTFPLTDYIPEELEPMRAEGDRYSDFIREQRIRLNYNIQFSVYRQEFDYLTASINADHTEVLIADDTATPNANYPDPLVIAKKFKYERTRSKDDTYSVDDIAFVMTYARDNPNLTANDVIDLYKNIIKEEQELEDPCPSKLKDLKRKQTPKRWIKFYDNEAAIERP